MWPELCTLSPAKRAAALAGQRARSTECRCGKFLALRFGSERHCDRRGRAAAHAAKAVTPGSAEWSTRLLRSNGSTDSPIAIRAIAALTSGMCCSAWADQKTTCTQHGLPRQRRRGSVPCTMHSTACRHDAHPPSPQVPPIAETAGLLRCSMRIKLLWDTVITGTEPLCRLASDTAGLLTGGHRPTTLPMSPSHTYIRAGTVMRARLVGSY